MKLTKSNSGISCLYAGGGGYTNTFEGRFIMRGKELAKAIFIRTRGTLACTLDQAVIPIKVGDIIVTVSGPYPIESENPDIYIRAKKITAIGMGQEASVIDTGFYFSDIPEQCIEGMKQYHNRDGKYFCKRTEETQ